MKKGLSYILLLLSVVMTLCSCTNREHNIGIPEGEAATISLSVKNMDPEIINATKGMTTPEEQDIENLFVMIFNSTGTLVVNQGFADMTSSLTMDTFSGSDMEIYVVANFTSIESELLSITNLNQLRELVKGSCGNAVNPGHLILLGNVTMDILADNTNRASVNLYYITAKITVKYIDATANQDITFFGWEAFDLPAKSYLIGRTSDATNTSIDSDFYSIIGENQWEKEEVLGGKHTLSESFYMFENRRGVKAGAENDYKKKSTYAEDFPKATYFKVSFNCLNRNNGNTYSVVTKIYLGANNYSDFNIQRGKHYTYTVTISGVNSITVNVSTDSNSQSVVLPLSITTSSSMTMDAHPDMRVINIKADDTKVSNVSIEVLDNASWVKVSPLNLTLHQVSQSSPAAALYQQPSPSGAAGYFVRPRFIPHKSFREANSSLAWSEWPAAGATDYDDDVMEFAVATYRMCYKITSIPVYDQDGQAICIYADEYPFIDGSSTRSAKLRIRYDDLQDDGMTKYVDYEIIQKQAMPIGPVVDTYNGSTTTYKDAVIEQIEESALILYPNLLDMTQQTRRMQWGYSGSLLFSSPSGAPKFDSFRDGSRLTDNAVYTNGSDRNSYRAKYASGPFNKPNAASAYSVSGTIPEPGYVSDNTGAPYYLPNISATPSNNKFYNPIFNTSAARYCHEKNRDLNGDGVIEGSEIQWYLPSQHELYQVWASLEAIRYSTTEFGSGYYWSSSESGTNSTYVIGFQTGFAKGISKSELDKTSGAVNQVVRCIRKTTTSSTNVVNANSIIDLSSMPADAITTQTKGSAASGSQGNNSSSTEKGISENAATAYYRFQVAKADASSSSMLWRAAVGYTEYYSGNYPADSRLNIPAGTFNNVYVNSTIMNGAPANALTGCPAYWEGSIDDPVTGQGHWRLPNKRELFIMWIYLSQLEEDSSFAPMRRNVYYWSSSERNTKNAHAVIIGNGTGDNPVKTTSNFVRCIREL